MIESMFSFLKKTKVNEFTPTKKMMEAAILKGKKIGLKRDEIIEMASLMDRSKTKIKIERIVDKILNQT